jgi:hypothetical protein
MKRSLLALAAAVVCIAWVLHAPPIMAGGLPLNLSNTADDSRNPALAAGADGSRHVVWEEVVMYSQTLTLPQLWRRAWTGAAWTSAISVSTGAEPALAVGPDYRTYLV